MRWFLGWLWIGWFVLFGCYLWGDGYVDFQVVVGIVGEVGVVFGVFVDVIYVIGDGLVEFLVDWDDLVVVGQQWVVVGWWCFDYGYFFFVVVFMVED